MGVRAQFLFSRNCLFISVTGEEPAMLQNKWDAGSYSDSVATKRALSLKKLGAAVIEKLRGCHNRRSSWTADRDRQDRCSPREILRSEKPFQIIPQV